MHTITTLLQNASEQRAKVTISTLEKDKKNKVVHIDEQKKKIETLSAKVCNNTKYTISDTQNLMYVD